MLECRYTSSKKSAFINDRDVYRGRQKVLSRESVDSGLKHGLSHIKGDETDDEKKKIKKEKNSRNTFECNFFNGYWLVGFLRQNV